MDYMHTGFNKTRFDKLLLGVIDFSYNCFIVKRIKNNPMYKFVQNSIKIKL